MLVGKASGQTYALKSDVAERRGEANAAGEMHVQVLQTEIPKEHRSWGQ